MLVMDLHGVVLGLALQLLPGNTILEASEQRKVAIRDLWDGATVPM